MTIVLYWEGKEVDPKAGPELEAELSSDPEIRKRIWDAFACADALLEPVLDDDEDEDVEPEILADFISHPDFLESGNKDGDWPDLHTLPGWIYDNADKLKITIKKDTTA